MNEFDIDLFDDNAVQEPFKIDSLKLAEWAMRKIERAELEMAKFEAMAKELKSQIDAKLAKLKAPHEHTITNMTVLLEPWISVEIAKQGGKKKSYSLLSGRAGYRQSPQSLNIVDESKAIADVEKRAIPNGIRKEINISAVKSYIKKTGEIPEGIETKIGAVKFYVQVGPDAITDETD